jgi:enediyne biosynthesis protein E4
MRLLPLLAAGFLVLPAHDDCRASFTDVATSVGLAFTHIRGATGQYQLPETMGSGVAWLDYDGDGWMDLYVVQSGPYPPQGNAAAQDRLFRNVRGRFVDVTREAGLHDTAYGMGAVAADYDNDGDTDLYVTNYGANILYRNNGDGTFTDVTTAAGVAAGSWSTSAAWTDIDNDGDLDLFVVRYLDNSADKTYFCGSHTTGERNYCHPDLYPGLSNVLFRNNGDGTFTDVTHAAGVDKIGKGLGVVVSDVDGDGRSDIYVANDHFMNFLFHNLGGGRFADVSVVSGAAFDVDGNARAGMGVDAGDLDGDGRPDLVVTNFDSELNSHYRNAGALTFEDVSTLSGFGRPSFNRLGFGLTLADFDRDGALDAFVVNGHIQVKPNRQGVTYAQLNSLVWNDGRGHFTERNCGPAFERRLVGRGSAVADFDNDGDLDVAISNSDGPLQLLRNDAAGGGWVGFQLRGTQSNRQGIGARLVLDAGSGVQVREARAGNSYLSSGDPRVFFGLGSAKPERLRVHWPSGVVQDIARPEAGRYHAIEEPRAARQ